MSKTITVDPPKLEIGDKVRIVCLDEKDWINKYEFLGKKGRISNIIGATSIHWYYEVLLNKDRCIYAPFNDNNLRKLDEDCKLKYENNFEIIENQINKKFVLDVTNLSKKKAIKILSFYRNLIEDICNDDKQVIELNSNIEI